MFSYRHPSKNVIDQHLAQQAQLPFSYKAVGATATTPPADYRVDRNRVQLGQGAATFAVACRALRAWTMFDLGWLTLHWPDAPITVGTTVGVLAHLPGCYSLNACRIVYVLDEERNGITRVGFAYGTLPDHLERGEERFTIEWRHHDDSVWYDILAFSRPQHWLVKIGYPVARYYQRRFARESLRRMKRAVK